MTRHRSADLNSVLQSMQPVLNEGVYVYVTLPSDGNPDSYHYLGCFREAEASTLIMPERQALEAGLPILFRAAWITLSVYSDLEAVGLTAACARVLAEAGISCNVLAAAYHDHLFVPYDQAQAALQELRSLQAAS